jgi:flagellar motor switch protein FliN/FliY
MPSATARTCELTCPDSTDAATDFRWEDFGDTADEPRGTDAGRRLVVLRLELGQTRLRAVEAERLNMGAVVPLAEAASDPVNVFADGRLVARGDLIVLDGRFCLRVTEVVGDPRGTGN